MILDLSKLVSSDYYFLSNPGGDFLFGYPLLIFFIALFFIGPTCEKKAIDNKYLKKAMKNQFWKFYFLGVIGIMLVLSRFAEVPGFSMRFWLYLIFISSLVIIGLTYHNIHADYKKRLNSVEREKKKRKQEDRAVQR